MKLALVTTPWEARSAVGEATRELVRHLAEHCEIEVFVERGRHGGGYFGWTTRSADELLPRDYDQVLYQVGNEREHAFMAPLVRALGGCVALHQWGLFELAAGAHPELERGGWRGSLAALREGGLAQARRYARAWRSRGIAELERLRSELPLNRSIVRFGDAFIVPSEELRTRVLEERNAPTAIGVLEPAAVSNDSARGGAPQYGWERAAGRCLELLERFPQPRTARKSLLGRRIAAGLGASRAARSPR
jgi:hypothetical protein